MTESSWRVLVHHPTRAEEYAAALREHFPEFEVEATADDADLARRVSSADVLVISAAIPFPDGIMERATRLRWIQVTSAGVDCIMTTAIPPGVRITRVTGSFGRQMSEYVLAYLFGAFYQLPRTFDNQRRRRWEHFVSRPLAGSIVGIAGTGAIGGAIARSLSALGCRVWGLARHPQPTAGFERVVGPDDWHEFLPSLDVLVLALPLTAETSSIIGRTELDLLNPTAYLVNVSRGALIDETALIAALDEEDSAAPSSTSSRPSRCRSTVRSGACPTSA